MRSRALLTALALLASACTGDDAAGPAEITEFAGTVETLGESGWVVAEGSVPNDARIRISGDGSYVLLEHDLGAIRLSAASGSSHADMTLAPGAIDLSFGDLLVALSEGNAVTVRAPDPGLQVVSDAGTIRLTVDVATRVAAYAGSAIATVIDQELFIASWHEASLRAGVLPANTEPIRLVETDAVDRYAASEILALDAELEALRRGFEAEFGVRIRSIDELDAIARDAARDPFTFTRPVIGTWGSGDVLVGVVLALLLEASGEGSLPEAFQRVRRLMERGASWGVMSAILGFTPDTIVDRVSRAVALRAGDVVPGQGEPINEPPPREEPTGFPRPTSSPAPSPTRTRTPRPTPSPSESSSGSPSPTTSPSPSDSPLPTPPPTTPAPTPSPTVPDPSGTCDPVNVIFGNC